MHWHSFFIGTPIAVVWYCMPAILQVFPYVLILNGVSLILEGEKKIKVSNELSISVFIKMRVFCWCTIILSECWPWGGWPKGSTYSRTFSHGLVCRNYLLFPFMSVNPKFISGIWLEWIPTNTPCWTFQCPA